MMYSWASRGWSFACAGSKSSSAQANGFVLLDPVTRNAAGQAIAAAVSRS